MIDRIRRQIDDLLDFLATGPSVASSPGVQVKPEIFEFDSRLNPSNITIGTPSPVNEGTALVFPVTLDSPPTSFPVTVDYTTVDGTAVAGTNYAATSGTVTFPLGTSTGFITVPTRVDNVVTPTLDMSVTLSNPSAGDTIVGGNAAGTILNTDVAQFDIISGTVQEGGQETFTITLTNPVSVPISVDFTTVDGTAAAGTNYVAATGQTVNFPAFTLSQTITVNTIQDNVVTPTLDFDGTLGNINDGGLTGFVVFASGTTPTAIANITNIDTAVLSISSATDTTEGGSIVYTLSLSKPSSGPVFVDFSTVDGTALASNGRYVPIQNQTVSFLNGATTQNVFVSTVDDQIVQGSENISGSLSNLSGISITLDPTAVPANILDNDTATLSTNGSFTATEGAGPVSIPLTLFFNTTGTGPIGLGKPVTVTFNGTGTAVQGTNYTITPATFAPGTYLNGSATASATFNVLDTARLKPTLQANLQSTILSDGTNGQVSSFFSTSVLVNVVSNDTATFSFTTPSSSVTEGNVNAPIGVTLTLNTTGTGTPGMDVPVNVIAFSTFAQGPGQALFGVNYNTSSVFLTFPAGDGTSFQQIANIAILQNNIVAGNVTVDFNLSAFTFGTTTKVGTPAVHTLTIVEDDTFQFQPPRIQLTQFNIPLTPGNFINTYLDTTTNITNPYSSPVSVVGGAELSGLTGKDIQSKTFTVPGFNEFNGGLAVSNGVVFAGASNPGIEGSSTNPYASSATDDASAIVSYNPGTQQFNVLGLFNRESTGLAVAPDGSLVNAWFDGTYGTATNPYQQGPDAAVIGLSRIDPVTGAETVLYQQALTAAQIANRSPSQIQHIGGVAVLPDGEIVFATSEEGVTGSAGSVPRDDTSTFYRYNPVTKSLTQLGTFSRETRSLATAKDGTVVSLFYDGTYGTNPYGPTAATIGISQIDPSTGNEQILDSVTVPNLPRASFGFSASTNPYSDGSDFQPGGMAILGSGDIVYSLEKSAVQQPGPSVSANQAIYRLYKPADKTTNANFAQYLGRTSSLASVPLLPTTTADTFTTRANQPLTISAAGVLANDLGQNGFPIRAILGTAPTAAQGTVTLNSDGSFTFTPATGFTGTASFTYTVTDGLATSAPVTVSIDVTNPHVSLYAIGAGAGGGPRVRVFNADGSQRFDFFAYEESFKGGVRVAVGDVNGDGVDDIVVGSGTGGGPRVRVFDGQTGGQIFDFMAYEGSFRGGVHVAVGDVNGDGKADIITGAGSTGAPRLRVLDATNLTPILDFYAFDESQIGGVRVAAGDLLGNGQTEIVAASGPSGNATVSVFSSAGSLLTTFNAFAADYRGGLFVNVIGGTSGQPGSIVVAQDTVPDFTGSVLNNLFPDLTQAQLIAPPTVRLFDPVSGASSIGLSFTESSEVLAYDEAFQNGVRVAGGPASGSNAPNGFSFITGPGEAANSLVKFFRKQGTTVTEVREFNAFEDSFQGGVYVAASSS